jgi:hypothetical protein
VGCLGCAGKLDNPERFGFLLDGGSSNKGDASSPQIDTTPPDCVTTIFKNRCGTAGCHVQGGTGQPDLVSADVSARLIDQSSSSKACGGNVYVSTSGEDSLLLQKLEANPPCGSPMPLTGDKLKADELSCISAWVEKVSSANGGGN